jgi:hypothetical protein
MSSPARIALLAAAPLLLLEIPITYSTLHGYSTWYWYSPHSRLFVDGQAVQGYVHRARRTRLVTRRDTQRPHSYLISYDGKFRGVVSHCGDWAAPPAPVFVIGHVNPPCWLVDDPAEHRPEAPASSVTVRDDVLEFRTNDGKLIRVER